jgi:hypothetical protein
MPVRVYDIAKKLGLENKEVITKAKAMGIASAKVPSSSIDKTTAARIEEELIKTHPEVAARLAPMPVEEKSTIKLIETNVIYETSSQSQDVGINRRLVIPIYNCKQPLASISPWLFAGDIRLDEIADEDFATLLRDQEEIFRPITTPKSQCFTTSLKDGQEAELALSETVAKFQFVFKSLSLVPLVLSHAAVVSSRENKKAVVEQVLPLPILGDYSKHSAPFTFKKDVSPEAVVKFYEIINTAISKHSAFLITLNRFNSCWLRSTEHDKIIDVAISLESLLSSSTEISFKFALFSSFIVGKTPSDREAAFHLFKLLYNARSKIVHGDIKGNIKNNDIGKAMESLPRILELAHAAISYYAFFLYCKSPGEWQEHLNKLVFGTEQLIEPRNNK